MHALAPLAAQAAQAVGLQVLLQPATANAASVLLGIVRPAYHTAFAADGPATLRYRHFFPSADEWEAVRQGESLAGRARPTPLHLLAPAAAAAAAAGASGCSGGPG